MIIGMILDVGAWNGNEPSSSSLNGAAMIQFYSYQDAINWAQDVSRVARTGSVQSTVRCLTMTYNTSTQERRWWFDGTEYTA